jgi:protease IV
MMCRKTAGLVLVMVISLLFTSCTLLRVELGPTQDPLTERTVSGSGSDKVLLVDISGVIMSGDSGLINLPLLKGEDMVQRLAEELNKAREDKHIKALLVRIDSPGGSVSASDLLYHLIESYQRDTGVKVVASMMGVAASGGYYVALAADKIYALPTTVTGSIGTLSLKLDVSGLMGKVGVETETVKSAPLKDMWSPFRPAQEQERAIMQSLIDQLYNRFKEKVAQKRPGMTPEQFQRSVTGRIFTAAEALELGLIDQVGYPEEAFAAARQMAGLSEARLVVYHRPGANPSSIYAQSNAGTALGGAGLLSLGSAPRPMYMWLPEAR